MTDPSLRRKPLRLRFAASLSLLLSCLSEVFGQAQTVSPTITLPPRSQSVSLGANVALRVTATGPPPLSFQWLWNHSPAEAATNSTLALTNLGLAQAGAYFVI